MGELMFTPACRAGRTCDTHRDSTGYERFCDEPRGLFLVRFDQVGILYQYLSSHFRERYGVLTHRFSFHPVGELPVQDRGVIGDHIRTPGSKEPVRGGGNDTRVSNNCDCLLYTSDAADDLTRVDLGGR